MEDPIDVRQSLVRPRPERPTRARVLGALLLLCLAACSPLKPRPDLPPENALPPAAATALDDAIARRENHPGDSGFRVADGVEAFALRGLSARQAGRSLDVQYYIWHDDLHRPAARARAGRAPPIAACACACCSTTWTRAQELRACGAGRAPEHRRAPVQSLRLAHAATLAHGRRGR